MKQAIILVLALVAILVGMGFVMPAVAKLRAVGSLPGLDVGLLFLGIGMTFAGLITGFLRLKSPARRG